MNQDTIHVYFIPGMAANSLIFEHIKLPKNQFKIHYLEWLIPIENESIRAYSKRMIQYIKHKNVVLIGVSFGGIVAQEISKLLKIRRLIIISSVKTKYELPRRMRFAKATKIYKLLPTNLVNNIDVLAKYAFGKTLKNRAHLYERYLSVRDKNYFNWAIKQVINWEQEEVLSNIIHIHGDKDPVFPYRYLTNCVTIKDGTHIMIINRYKWFNENLPKLILEEKLA